MFRVFKNTIHVAQNFLYMCADQYVWIFWRGLPPPLAFTGIQLYTALSSYHFIQMLGESGRKVFKKVLSCQWKVQFTLYWPFWIVYHMGHQYPVHFFQHHTELRIFISLEFIVLKILLHLESIICNFFGELTFNVLNINIKFQLIKHWWRLW